MKVIKAFKSLDYLGNLACQLV